MPWACWFLLSVAASKVPWYLEARATSCTMPHLAHLFTYKIANFKPLHPRYHQSKSFKISGIHKKSNKEAISLILSENFKFIILLN
jgi:hypothetical protein